MASPVTNVISVNGAAPAATAMTAKTLLLDNPAGSYTTFRTVGSKKAVLEYDFHLKRLANTVDMMVEGQSNELGAKAAAIRSTIGNFQFLATFLRPVIRDVTHQYDQLVNTPPENLPGAQTTFTAEELRFSILVHWHGQDAEQSVVAGLPPYVRVLVHAAPMPQRPTPPVIVEVRGHPREHAAAKDSQWVKDRQSLEDAMSKDANEVLLADDNNALYEGLSSNVFAVRDDKVYTAPDGAVLSGTIRKIVLELCKKEGIEVVMEAPSIDMAELWQGLFITSTSRLLLPVDVMRQCQAGGCHREYAIPRGEILQRLESLVAGHVVRTAEMI